MTTYAALHLTASGPSDGVLTLTVEGALDYDTSGYFTDHVGRALMDHSGIRVLRLDCSALSGVDSMGLSTLLGLRRRLDTSGASLRIVERSARLDRLLTITGTFDYLVGAEEAAQKEPESAGAASVAEAESGSVSGDEQQARQRR
ncbi:STAS domain-containing protein [Streptomyces sp. NPDC016845]|uniref:STAS domain-containing protein n=1 Tax=Streptomyces sp. NPDC016845 TaxID=3364972 RepID=UPI0037ACDD2B